MFRFNENSKFMSFVSRLVDVLWLNVLWLVCSLPLITIGAATAAAHDVCLRMVDDEEGYIARSFFRAFRSNVVPGTVLWLINAVAVYALYLDWQIIIKDSDPSIAGIVIGIVATVLIFCAFIYAYPLTARYRNGVFRTIANSMRICSRYAGRTLILAIVLAIEIGVFSWNSVMILVGILIGPIVLIYTVSGVAKRTFVAIDRENGSAS